MPQLKSCLNNFLLTTFEIIRVLHQGTCLAWHISFNYIILCRQLQKNAKTIPFWQNISESCWCLLLHKLTRKCSFLDNKFKSLDIIISDHLGPKFNPASFWGYFFTNCWSSEGAHFIQWSILNRDNYNNVDNKIK